MNHDRFVKEKMALIAQERTILDVGGGEPFTKWLGAFKDQFAEKDYRTLDYDASTKPTIVGDIHDIPLEDETIDAVICASVLEHITNPHLAVSEMRRVLRKGGKIFVYVPSIYPYHARKGHYPDLWRLFDDSLNLLFKDFSSVELCKRGGYFLALSFFVPFQHKLRWLLNPVATFLDKVFSTGRRTTTAGYYLFAVK